ncbi:DUF3530 family protein [Marinobacterium sp. YM272]|uniref:DUF3530 family protein n=1 Tax=Marinobacterium sp. YM272 TaxID=3421654 RepID=UPI003D7FF97A
MNSLINKTLITLLLLCPVQARAAEEAENTASAAAPGMDMAKLYEVERSSAGNLPLDSQLRKLLPADTVVLTMEVGEQRFHALRQEANREDAVGGLLLVPDPAIGPAWVNQVEALRFDLAQKGWLTLALEPPASERPSLPERTLPVMQPINAGSAGASGAVPSDSAQPTPAADTAQETNAEPPAPFAERFSERMDLVLEQLRSEPLEPLVVISFGRATPWTIDYLLSHPELDLALVMIDPLPDSAPDAPVLTTLLESLGDMRIVDIYHAPLPGYPRAAPDARIRKDLARREGLANYLQSPVSGSFTGWNDEMPWLTAKVRGLIKAGILAPIAEEQEEAAAAAPAPGQNQPGARPIN